MINLMQGFKIGSIESIDSRFVLSKNDMYHSDDNMMPNYYFAVCKDDGLLYVYIKDLPKTEPTGRFVLANGLVDDVKVDGVSVVTGGTGYNNKKVANLHIPLAVSELTNDANYAKISEVDVKDQAVKNWADGKFALIDKAAYDISLELNQSTYELQAVLYDLNGVEINRSNIVDLPIESFIVKVEYDAATKELVITLKNGQVLRVPLSGIISGLATEQFVTNKIAEEDVAIKAWSNENFYNKTEAYKKEEVYSKSEADLKVSQSVAAEANARNNADENLQNQILQRPTESDVINMLLAKQNKFDAGQGLTWNNLTSEGLSLDADKYVTGQGINVTDVTPPGAKYKTYQLNADAVSPTWALVQDKPFDVLGNHLVVVEDSEGKKLNVDIPNDLATKPYVDSAVAAGISQRPTTAKVSEMIGAAVGKVDQDLTEHKADTVAHTNVNEKAAWNAKYDKPAAGIPKSDLDAGVKASLDKADTAIQSMTDYRTAAAQDVIDQALQNGKVDKVEGKGLSANDFTTEEKNKLAGIAANAQVNVLEGVKVDNVELAIADKKVNISLASKANLVNGKVPLEELPSFIIASVVEGYYDEPGNAFYEDEAKTIKITPEAGKIYIDKPTSKSYKWLGSLETGRYVEIDNSNTYYSVAPNVSTMGELREYINSVNMAGLHCFFDMHGHANDAYVCLIHMYTSGGVNYCDVFDMLNRRYYFNAAGYQDATLISAYIDDANKQEIITDISSKEDKANKVTAFGATPSDVKYPSEKLVKDNLDGKAALVHTHTKSQITDFPEIPVVNDGVLTVQKNGVDVGTFSANAASAATINLELNKSDVGLTNVENKSSETIRSEITEANITSKVNYDAGAGLEKTGSAGSYKFGITNNPSITIEVADWQAETTSEGTVLYYSAIKAVEKVTEFSNPVLDIIINPSDYAAVDAKNEAWSKVYSATTANGSITFYAKEKPEIAITVQAFGF